METKQSCKVLLKNNKKQKVKCYKFFQKDIEREIAVHEDVENKNVTSITDVLTGLRLKQIHKEIRKVTEAEIEETLIKFIGHYTIDSIKSKFQELDKDRDKKD